MVLTEGKKKKMNNEWEKNLISTCGKFSKHFLIIYLHFLLDMFPDIFLESK